jgi:hypothetical protein
MSELTTARIRRHKRRRILAALASMCVLVATGGYWLANDGAFALNISPPASLAANGGIKVSYTPLTATATTIGTTPAVRGYAIGKLALAQGFAAGTRLSIFWTDKQRVSLVGNSSAFLTFQVFYPIHTGACNGDAGTVLTINDGSTLCTKLDSLASVSFAWASDAHTLELTSAATPMKLSGWLEIGTSDPTSGTCAATGSTWCSVSGTSNVAYLVASVTLGSSHLGGGNQNQIPAELNFYVQARAGS